MYILSVALRFEISRSKVKVLEKAFNLNLTKQDLIKIYKII